LPVAAAAGFGGLASRKAPAVYKRLSKPPWAPPASAFGPVWSTLYLAIAVAGWRIYATASPMTRRLHLTQLALNGAWPAAFFGIRDKRASLVIIAALDLSLGLEVVGCASASLRRATRSRYPAAPKAWRNARCLRRMAVHSLARGSTRLIGGGGVEDRRLTVPRRRRSGRSTKRATAGGDRRSSRSGRTLGRWPVLARGDRAVDLARGDSFLCGARSLDRH
jgi:TspO/MBR family